MFPWRFKNVSIAVDRVTQGSASYFSGHRGGSHHHQINTLHARIYTRKYRLETTFNSNKLCTTYNAHKLRWPDIYFAFRWSERTRRSRFKNASIAIDRVTHGSTFILFRSLWWSPSPPNSHSVCTLRQPNIQIRNRLLPPCTTYSARKLRWPDIYFAFRWIGHVKRRWRSRMPRLLSMRVIHSTTLCCCKLSGRWRWTNNSIIGNHVPPFWRPHLSIFR